jgi:hypothetical protein
MPNQKLHLRSEADLAALKAQAARLALLDGAANLRRAGAFPWDPLCAADGTRGLVWP